MLVHGPATAGAGEDRYGGGEYGQGLPHGGLPFAVAAETCGTPLEEVAPVVPPCIIPAPGCLSGVQTGREAGSRTLCSGRTTPIDVSGALDVPFRVASPTPAL
jgi:hypothetical protein